MRFSKSPGSEVRECPAVARILNRALLNRCKLTAATYLLAAMDRVSEQMQRTEAFSCVVPEI